MSKIQNEVIDAIFIVELKKIRKDKVLLQTPLNKLSM